MFSLLRLLFGFSGLTILILSVRIDAAQAQRKTIAVLPALESEKVFSAREDARLAQAILDGLMDGLGNNQEFKS